MFRECEKVIFLAQNNLGEMRETKKIRQNSEKWGCNSLWCILIAEFHLY